MLKTTLSHFQYRLPYKKTIKFFSSMGEAPPKHQINFLRGWPHPSLLPTTHIQNAANAALSNSSVSTPALLYGPDPGYQPLRESIADWLGRFYGPSLRGVSSSESTVVCPERGEKGDVREADGKEKPDPERICISGGASQNLACVLQVYSDPLYTKVHMIAPSYFLACRVFTDAGLGMRAVGEGSEGVDLVALERSLLEADKERSDEVSFVSGMGNDHVDDIFLMQYERTL
jgi:DNA-binding transcriptional MocR family regulator